MSDLVVFLTESQKNLLQKMAYRKGLSNNQVMEGLLDKVYKTIDEYLAEDVSYKFRTYDGVLFHVHVPCALVKSAKDLINAHQAIPAIKLIRTEMNLGLKEAKAIVDIMRGLQDNLT